MRKLLCILALLLLHCALPAHSQTLTLGEIVDLDGMEQMKQDAYLVRRGWVFNASERQGDSIFDVSWHFYNSKNRFIAQFLVRKQLGQRSLLNYWTALRPAFDDIRENILAVPGIDVIGTSNDDKMRTLYRDKRYNFGLAITNDEDGLNYLLSAQCHGLVKGYYIKEDGTSEDVWMQAPVYTPEQKRRLDAMVDSLDRRTKALRAEGLRSEALRKKSRK